MATFISDVVSFIAANPHYAYLAVLLLAFSESFPLIGAAVPGSGIIVALAALVPSGTLKLWPLLLAAIVGAIIGDGFSYWLGRRHGQALLARWPLRNHPEIVEKSEGFFARHGNKSVFLARFTPGVRAVVPLFAGILHMPARRFYGANILSAFAWALSHILPGVFVGASFGLFGGAAKSLALLAAVLVALLWLGYHLLRWITRRGPALLTSLSNRVHAFLRRRPEPWAQRLAARFEDGSPELRRLLLPGLIIAGAAWAFLSILEDVANGDPLVNLDKSIFEALQQLRSPPADLVMLTFTELGDTFVVIAVTAGVFLWLAWKRAWRTALYWVGAVASASALNTIIKLALHRARPLEHLYTGSSAFSFPSGHSTTNAVLYGFLAYLVARGVGPQWRGLVALLAAGMVLMIAASRLYLGAHWFSDVAGGLAFATMWLTVITYSYQRAAPVPLDGRKLAAVFLLVLALAGGFNVWRHHTSDAIRYVAPVPSVSLTREQWWSGSAADLPLMRTDITGEAEEPFGIQWGGSLAELQGDLTKGGWQTPPGWSMRSVLGWFNAATTPMELPVVPRFESGRLPAMTLIRPDPELPAGARDVLRVFPSDVMLQSGGEPVWLIAITREQFTRPLSLFTVLSSDPASAAVIDQAAAALPNAKRSGAVWLAEP